MTRTRTRKLLVLCIAAGVALLVASSALAWTVTMTANTSLKRTYSWKIEKSVSQASVTLAPGATANVSYSVTATPTGSVDSDWAVSGHVHMSEEIFPQPDPAPVVNTLNVTIQPDDLAAPVTCVPSPFPVDLDTNSLHCDYAAPLPDASGPRDAHMRAQQVNGNQRSLKTPFDFSNPTVNLVDESVTVTDSMGGTLGTVNAADGPKTFTYTKTIGPYTAAQCGSKTRRQHGHLHDGRHGYGRQRQHRGCGHGHLPAPAPAEVRTAFARLEVRRPARPELLQDAAAADAGHGRRPEERQRHDDAPGHVDPLQGVDLDERRRPPRDRAAGGEAERGLRPGRLLDRGDDGRSRRVPGDTQRLELSLLRGEEPGQGVDGDAREVQQPVHPGRRSSRQTRAAGTGTTRVTTGTSGTGRSSTGTTTRPTCLTRPPEAPPRAGLRRSGGCRPRILARMPARLRVTLCPVNTAGVPWTNAAGAAAARRRRAARRLRALQAPPRGGRSLDRQPTVCSAPAGHAVAALARPAARGRTSSTSTSG